MKAKEYVKKSFEKILAIKFDINDPNSLNDLKEFVESNTIYKVHFDAVQMSSSNNIVDKYYLMYLENGIDNAVSTEVRDTDYILIGKPRIGVMTPFTMHKDAFELIYEER